MKTTANLEVYLTHRAQRWTDDWRDWRFHDAGVKLVILEGPVNAGVKILFDGKEIEV